MEKIALLQQKWDKGISYLAYRQLINELLADNKTTGPNQSQFMVDYTQLNNRRMKRLDKMHTVSQELQQAVASLPAEKWLVISEAWCGDAAQSLPILSKIAQANPNIELRIVFRDEHPELMQEYLTEGGKSIPILIRISEDFAEEKGYWGPRPEPAQQMLREFKAQNTETYEQFAERLHAWYAKDKGKLIEAEFLALLQKHA